MSSVSHKRNHHQAFVENPVEAIEELNESAEPSLSDAEKKILQLSLQEMRNARLLRFDTSSKSSLSPDASKSGELKRKTRYESFGMPIPSSAADEEPKKKARLARFAPASNIDPVKEDKIKARGFDFNNSRFP